MMALTDRVLLLLLRGCRHSHSRCVFGGCLFAFGLLGGCLFGNLVRLLNENAYECCLCFQACVVCEWVLPKTACQTFGSSRSFVGGVWPWRGA
jgi:hypothetical protein